MAYSDPFRIGDSDSELGWAVLDPLATYVMG